MPGADDYSNAPSAPGFYSSTSQPIMITTGKTPITASTLTAILSLSLVVNLPGLAVTPMLGTLQQVFPHATQIETQLLTVLPNLLIIPFVLLSGKLSLSHHKIATIAVALVVFMASAVAYLFAKSMLALIIFSCTLGCGAGLLIPFSTGLLADTFVGKYRMHEMGVQSGLSNLTLVIATYAVGWLSAGSWHLPFTVYLVAIVPILLLPWLKKIPKEDLENPCPQPFDVDSWALMTHNLDEDEQKRSDEAKHMAQRAMTHDGDTTIDQPADLDAPAGKKKVAEKVVNGFYINRILGLIGVYFFITFATISISYYCPFLIEKKGWSSSLAGTVNSLYFVGIFVTGFTLIWLVKGFKSWTFVMGGILMTGGLALISFIHAPWSLCVGSLFCGVGYGMCQPMIYDKASRAVISTSKATLALAFVLASNYLSIVCTPFIIDFLRSIFNGAHITGFAFWVCFILSCAYLALTIVQRHGFAFNVDKSYYS